MIESCDVEAENTLVEEDAFKNKEQRKLPKSKTIKDCLILGLGTATNPLLFSTRSSRKRKLLDLNHSIMNDFDEEEHDSIFAHIFGNKEGRHYKDVITYYRNRFRKWLLTYLDIIFVYRFRDNMIWSKIDILDRDQAFRDIVTHFNWTSQEFTKKHKATNSKGDRITVTMESLLKGSIDTVITSPLIRLEIQRYLRFRGQKKQKPHLDDDIDREETSEHEQDQHSSLSRSNSKTSSSGISEIMTTPLSSLNTGQNILNATTKPISYNKHHTPPSEIAAPANSVFVPSEQVLSRMLSNQFPLLQTTTQPALPSFPINNNVLSTPSFGTSSATIQTNLSQFQRQSHFLYFGHNLPFSLYDKSEEEKQDYIKRFLI